jgi:hypothetical protein
MKTKSSNLVLLLLIIGLFSCSEKYSKLTPEAANDPVKLSKMYKAGNIPARFMISHKYLLADNVKKRELNTIYGVDQIWQLETLL